MSAERFPTAALKAAFENAFSNFLKNERSLIISDVSERSLCGKLGEYLGAEAKARGWREYSADSEYNRMQQGKVKKVRLKTEEEEIVTITSDLLLHARGEAFPENLITVEMKKEGASQEKLNKDRARLEGMTIDPNNPPASFNHVYAWEGSYPAEVCGYLLGVYVIIDVATCNSVLEYYVLGEFESRKQISAPK